MDFVNFLVRESYGSDLLILILAFVVLAYIWEETIVALLGRFGYRFERLGFQHGYRRCLTAVIASPILEELFFRAPLVFALYFGGLSGVIVASVVSSVIFGACHGKPVHILIEGMLGLMWCLLFFKSGGLRASIDLDVFILARATVISIVAHSVYNMLWIASNSFRILSDEKARQMKI